MMTSTAPLEFKLVCFSPSRAFKEMLTLVMASLFIVFCNQIRIPLPFSPVPLTMQTFGFMLLGATLGSRRAAFTVLIYFAEVLIGLPVLSGWSVNPLVFLSPLGGYVMGFLAQAVIVGVFKDFFDTSRLRALFALCLISSAVQLGMGAFYLQMFVGWDKVLLLGILPFIPGEIVKSLMVCLFIKKD